MSAPRLACLLIRLASTAAHRDDALGDLEEAHRHRRARGAARAWLGSMAEAIVIAGALLWHRMTRVAWPGRDATVSLIDVRLAFRLLVRQPLLATTAIVSLSVGIALATVGFATMEALLFSRLPYDNGDRFVRLTITSQVDRDAVMLTAESYARLATPGAGLAHVGMMTGGLESVELPTGEVSELTTAAITPSSLGYLPAVPLRGRLLTREDGAPGSPPVAMVSERLWRRNLGAAESAVRSTLVVGGKTRTIVGVMPEAFEFPNVPAIWLPLDERFRDGAALPDGDARIFGVMTPGTTVADLATRLPALSAQLRPVSGAAAVSLEVRGFTDLGPMAPVLTAGMVIAVLAVLLVIAANVGNLVLARSLSRVREFALRAALGASRARLVSQVMVEVLVLVAIAAIVGSIGAQAVLRQFNTMDELPFWVDFTGSTLTAVLVVAATVISTAIAGAWPALRATRRDLLPGLQSADGRSSDVRFGRAAGVMLVVQIAVSVVLLHGSLVVAQAFRAYTDVDLDLPRNVLATRLQVNAPLTATEVERIASQLPGVTAVGASTALPRHSPQARFVEVEPAPGQPASRPRLAPSAEVSPGFFEALDTSARAGRVMTAADALPGAPAVAVVNDPFVKEMLGGAAAVGRRFRVMDDGRPGPWLTVVGVVPELGLSVGDPTLAAGYYLPLTAETNTIYLALRVNGEPLKFVEPLRRALRTRDAELVMGRGELLEDVALDDRSFFGALSAALIGIGAITLVLALAGVYSMMSLIVSRRTREIGIRVALGASTTRVIRAVATRAGVQVCIGGLLGAVLAVFSLEARGILVSRLGDGGWWTMPVVIGLLVLSGIAATWVPLRRALRIRPQEALKAE